VSGREHVGVSMDDDPHSHKPFPGLGSWGLVVNLLLKIGKIPQVMAFFFGININKP